jgi:hypothetical protein
MTNFSANSRAYLAASWSTVVKFATIALTAEVLRWHIFICYVSHFMCPVTRLYANLLVSLTLNAYIFINTHSIASQKISETKKFGEIFLW